MTDVKGRICPHGKADRLMVSETMVRKTLPEGGERHPDFSRPEVLEILKEYCAGLDQNVEVRLHGAAAGETKKGEQGPRRGKRAFCHSFPRVAAIPVPGDLPPLPGRA